MCSSFSRRKRTEHKERKGKSRYFLTAIEHESVKRTSCIPHPPPSVTGTVIYADSKCRMQKKTEKKWLIDWFDCRTEASAGGRLLSRSGWRREYLQVGGARHRASRHALVSLPSDFSKLDPQIDMQEMSYFEGYLETARHEISIGLG